MSLQYMTYRFAYRILVICLISCLDVTAKAQGYRPPNGFIPDAGTAVRVAEAVLGPIYGEEKIKNERPFVATLDGDIWTVTGHLDEGYHGGVAEIRIAKNDGRILEVGHGK
jgi:hypothetical protein